MTTFNDHADTITFTRNTDIISSIGLNTTYFIFMLSIGVGSTIASCRAKEKRQDDGKTESGSLEYLRTDSVRNEAKTASLLNHTCEEL
ncbi:hypothetical protein BN2476_1530021 [Paraburkholderia piptadeniae]|uniref:Uncharacterized protein n=1 Tax=Paraburkholderia piptadeniae TaxID=1701573 RepID=A0A1N7SWT4_9BURK|nr:hypothetical protein BN2476_1530021 [Paraburkholderia piptadeniae]